MGLPAALSPDSTVGLAALNAEVGRRAALMGYVGDFSIMMIVTLVPIPLLLLIRQPRRAGAGGAPADMAH